MIKAQNENVSEAEFDRYLDEFFIKLGLKLRNFRLEKKISLDELAMKMNTDKANISRIEHGGHNMTVEYLLKIAHFLGRPVRIDVL